MNGHFVWFVMVEGQRRPAAGFTTEDAAVEYAIWASVRVVHVTLEVLLADDPDCATTVHRYKNGKKL